MLSSSVPGRSFKPTPLREVRTVTGSPSTETRVPWNSSISFTRASLRIKGGISLTGEEHSKRNTPSRSSLATRQGAESLNAAGSAAVGVIAALMPGMKRGLPSNHCIRGSRYERARSWSTIAIIASEKPIKRTAKTPREVLSSRRATQIATPIQATKNTRTLTGTQRRCRRVPTKNREAKNIPTARARPIPLHGSRHHSARLVAAT